MFKKIGLLIFLGFNLVAFWYLITPTPEVPDLPHSVKSTEEGDTVQIPNVAGYFTDQNRQQVMSFYSQVYRSPLLIHLNHPPERAKIIFKDTMQSYYLEEFVIPFKESLFVNGYEWENDVFTKPDKRAANKLLVGNQVFKAKITTRVFPTSVPKRLFSFFGTEVAIIYALYVAKSVVFSKRS
ncbi:hypothetical protein M1116_00545 [Patescibacteria group bacterium]|nr:hypothetical protein [Patescibacteria group bacterium]